MDDTLLKHSRALSPYLVGLTGCAAGIRVCRVTGPRCAHATRARMPSLASPQALKEKKESVREKVCALGRGTLGRQRVMPSPRFVSWTMKHADPP